MLRFFFLVFLWFTILVLTNVSKRSSFGGALNFATSLAALGFAYASSGVLTMVTLRKETPKAHVLTTHCGVDGSAHSHSRRYSLGKEVDL